MEKRITTIYCLIILSLFSTAFANNSIKVHDAWVRSAPPNAKVLAAYMVIMNKSGEQRALTAVSSSKFEKIEMHKTEIHEGMMKMVPQKQLSIPAGGALTLEPGGYHLMLINPESVPQEGEHINFELHFDNGKVINVSAPVRKGRNTHEHQQHDNH